MNADDQQSNSSSSHKRLVEISSSYCGYIGIQHKDLWAKMFQTIEDYVDSEYLPLKQVEADKALLTSDLAWCLGKLRGLNNLAEHLEKKHDLGPDKKEAGSTEPPLLKCYDCGKYHPASEYCECSFQEQYRYRLRTGEWLPSALAVLFAGVVAHPHLAVENSVKALALADAYAEKRLKVGLNEKHTETNRSGLDKKGT